MCEHLPCWLYAHEQRCLYTGTDVSAGHRAVQRRVCVYGLHVSDQGTWQCLQWSGVCVPCWLVDESQSQHDVTDGGEFLRIKRDVLGYWNPAAADQLRVLHCEYGL